MTVFRGFKPLPILLSFVVVAATLFSATSAYAAGPMYFVHALPQGSDRAGRSIQTVIYRWDDATQNLVEVWSPPANTRTSNLDIYLEAGYVVIGEGHYSPRRLHILPLVSGEDTTSIDLSEFDYVPRYYLLRDSAGNYTFRITHRDRTSDGKSVSSMSMVSLKQPELTREAPPVVTDMTPEVSYGDNDNTAFTFRTLPEAGAVSVYESVTIDVPLLPDSLCHDIVSYGWTWFASTDDFYAFFAAMESDRPDQALVLVYDRNNESWHRYEPVGAATRLRPLNGWLVGHVAGASPNNDYERRVFHTPVERDQMVVLNPMTGHTFYVPMGTWSDILWLEDDAVYYRAFDTLYRARIENDAFVDRELLLQGETAFYMTAAYRGRD